MSKRTIYTTAPADYDYTGWTTQVGTLGRMKGGGDMIRVVETDEDRAEGQRARYASGLYFATFDRTLAHTQAGAHGREEAS